MNPDVFHTYLRQYFADARLSEKQVTLLQEMSRFRTLKKGERIFYGGAICRLCLLIKGRLKLVDCMEEEHPVFKDLLYPGNLFGDIVLSDKTMSCEYIEALTNNTLIGYCFTADIKRMIEHEPKLAFFFATTLAKKLKRVQRNHLMLRSKDAKARLIHFFHSWAKADGRTENGNIVLENYLTISDIAEYIAATRQTVHSLLKALKNEGAITWDKKLVTINLRVLVPG